MYVKSAGLASALLICAATVQAAPVTLIDGLTQGRYNQGIGTLLNGTGAAFPTSTDPTLDFVVAPNLSAASAPLGSWLTTPAAPGGTWTGAQAIPASWTVGDETAIIYEIDAGAGLSGVIASFGVDNGIFVWLDGVFLGGHLRPGSAILGEHSFNVGTLSAGTHYLQVLREDHGGGTGYQVSVTAAQVPVPATLWLVCTALAGLGLSRRRR